MSIERMRERLAADRASFVEPCLPSPAAKAAGRLQAGFTRSSTTAIRLMARRDPVGIRLITRRGHDWAARYPLVVEAVNHLRVRSVPDRRRKRAARVAALPAGLFSWTANPRF